MSQYALGMLGFAWLVGGFAEGAQAQDAMVSEVPSASITQLEQSQQSLTWKEFEYKSLQRSARRSRNALIGTSVATVVGTAIAFPIAAKCVQYDVMQGSDFACPTRGYEAGLTIGAMMFWGGLVGTLTTGIMLGVRKGKMRRLDDQIAIGKSGSVRFDPVRTRFVF